MRINSSNINSSNAPKATPAPAAAQAAKVAAKAPADRLLTQAVRPYVDVIPGKDALTFKVEKGATLYTIASQYAPDYDGDNQFGQVDAKDTQRFIKELKKANGLWFGWLRAGQTFRVPTQAENTNFNLKLAIAIQKSTEQRRKAGESLPQLDFGKIKVESGPAESFKVSVKVKGKDQYETFYVADDLSGQRPNGFQVLRPSETPFEQPHKPATTVTPGESKLTVTVTHGQTLWSLAKKFAPDDDGSKVVEGPEIRRYIEAIKQVNGLKSDTIAAGAELVLPSAAKGSNLDLRLAIAVQQAFNDRRAAGEALPFFDYSTINVEQTKNGASVVSFQLYEDPASMAVAVKPDASGKYPNGYDVFLPHEAPEYFD